MAVTSVAMETTVEFSYVSSLIWTILTPYFGKLVMFNIIISEGKHYFSSFFLVKIIQE